MGAGSWYRFRSRAESWSTGDADEDGELASRERRGRRARKVNERADLGTWRAKKRVQESPVVRG